MLQFLPMEHNDGNVPVEYALGHQPGRVCYGDTTAAGHVWAHVVYKL